MHTRRGHRLHSPLATPLGLRRRSTAPPFRLQPSAAVRLEVGEDDENPYEGQEGTQVTAAVTGALRVQLGTSGGE